MDQKKGQMGFGKYKSSQLGLTHSVAQQLPSLRNILQEQQHNSEDKHFVH